MEGCPFSTLDPLHQNLQSGTRFSFIQQLVTLCQALCLGRVRHTPLPPYRTHGLVRGASVRRVAGWANAKGVCETLGSEGGVGQHGRISGGRIGLPPLPYNPLLFHSLLLVCLLTLLKYLMN